MPHFSYKVFPASQVVELFLASFARPGSYIASDGPTDAIISALAEGYRWARTDGDLAIFELEHANGLPAPESLADCSCGAKPGEVHKGGCFVERCSVCGRLWMNCGCAGHDRAFARWTGYWPGKLETEAMGIDLNEFERRGTHRVLFVKPLMEG